MSPVSINERLLLGGAPQLLDRDARFKDSMHKLLGEIRLVRENESKFKSSRREFRFLATTTNTILAFSYPASPVQVRSPCPILSPSNAVCNPSNFRSITLMAA